MGKRAKPQVIKSLTDRFYEMAAYANDGQKCRVVIEDGNGGETSWDITGDEIADILAALAKEIG